MNRRYYVSLVAIVFLLPLLLTGPVSAYVSRVGRPMLDQIQAEVESDPAQATIKFLAGIFDFVPDIIRQADLDDPLTAGHKAEGAGGYHFCFEAINCRDYVPSDAGQPNAGASLYPLNLTDFRAAVMWSGLSLAQKAAAINTIYGGGIVTPAYSPVPPAYGPFHNAAAAALAPGGNYTKAAEYLIGAGFDNTTTPGTLLAPNGLPVRNFEVQSPLEAPTSIAFAQAFVDQWNDFFGNYMGCSNPTFTNTPLSFGPNLIPNLFQYRNYDFTYCCYGLGTYPDHIYGMFHSTQEGVWMDNFSGYSDPILDDYVYEVRYGTVYEDKVAACHAAQERLLEVHPVIYFYHRTYWTVLRVHTPDELVSHVNVVGTGTDNGWTWDLMHWATTTGGLAKYNWGLEPDSLHPGWFSTAYEAWIIEKTADGLIAQSPNLDPFAWIATDWDISPFVWAPLGISDGLKITYHIRNDLYWNDGFPLTAEDMKFALEFALNFPGFASTMDYFMWAEVEDPKTISVYVNSPGQTLYTDYSGLMLIFPKHIYDPDAHPTLDTIGLEAPIQPWETDWDDWMADYTGTMPGTAGFPYTALVFSGTWNFVEYDAGSVTANLTKDTQPNGDFFKDSPIEGAFNMPGRVDPDTSFDYEVVITNGGSEDNVTGEFTGCTIGTFIVKIDGGVYDTQSPGTLIQSFSSASFGPYTVTGGLSAGTHTMTVEVYEAGVAEPIDVTTETIIVTPKEDLNYDIYIGIDDIVRAAEAFGASPPPFPGNERWDSRADLNDDWYCGIDDIVNIAEDFGGP